MKKFIITAAVVLAVAVGVYFFNQPKTVAVQIISSGAQVKTQIDPYDTVGATVGHKKGEYLCISKTHFITGAYYNNQESEIDTASWKTEPNYTEYGVKKGQDVTLQLNCDARWIENQ